MKKPLFILSLSLGIVVFLLLIIRTVNRQITNIVDKLPRGAGSYASRDLSQITDLIIHHSAADGYTAYDYASWHIDRDWPGIGYHYVIDPAGRIFQTQELTTVSYHTSGANTKSVGIALSGNLSAHPMTGAQEQSLLFLLRKLKRQLPNVSTIGGHREYTSTECPGSYTDINYFRKKS